MPVTRTPDPSLLQECAIPALSDPDTATDNDFAADMLNLAHALMDCRERNHNLIEFEKAGHVPAAR